MRTLAKLSAGTEARSDPGDVASYQRHRPEQTLLYRIVEQYYPGFLELLALYGPPRVCKKKIIVHMKEKLQSYIRPLD